MVRFKRHFIMFFFHIVFTPFRVLKDPLYCLHKLLRKNSLFCESFRIWFGIPSYQISLYIRSNNFYFDGLDFFAVIFTKQLIVWLKLKMFFLSSNFVSGLQRTSSVSVSDGRKVEEKEVKQKFKNVSKNFFFLFGKVLFSN